MAEEIDDGDVGFGIAPEPRRVIWEMTYPAMRNNPGHTDVIFESELALAALLINEVVFLNAGQNLTTGMLVTGINVYALCNDTFAWGLSDAELVDYTELRDLYEHHIKDPEYGTYVWCCIKRRMMPQYPVAQAIRKANIWDIDGMKLQSNWYDGLCAKMSAENIEPESSWENEGGK